MIDVSQSLAFGTDGFILTSGKGKMRKGEEEFLAISRIVKEKAGLRLPFEKREILKAKIAKRIGKGQPLSLEKYSRTLFADGTGAELERLIEDVTIQYTHFFRETEHFAFLDSEVFPRIFSATMGGTKAPAIWCAGCATGEEIYSLAIHALEFMRKKGHTSQPYFLGTDISQRALEEAQKGIYNMQKTRDIPRPILRAYFLRGEGPWEGFVRVKSDVRRRIHFLAHNLLDEPPALQSFDVIFCRNVLIHMESEARQRVLANLREALKLQGYLFLSHTESIRGAETGLTYVQPSIYQRT